MTNYVPHYRKKIDGLEKREKALMAAIRVSEPLSKVIELAREVREAKLRVINAKRSRARPADSDENRQLFAAWVAEEAHWRQIDDGQIVNIYQQDFRLEFQAVDCFGIISA